LSTNPPHGRCGFEYDICIGGHATLKMLRLKSKTQFVKQERNTHNAITLLNYLKHIAPQQLMLRTQVFTIFFLALRAQAQLF
jgi:hypothetical protein